MKTASIRCAEQRALYHSLFLARRLNCSVRVEHGNIELSQMLCGECAGTELPSYAGPSRPRVGQKTQLLPRLSFLSGQRAGINPFEIIYTFLCGCETELAASHLLDRITPTYFNAYRHTQKLSNHITETVLFIGVITAMEPDWLTSHGASGK